MAKKGDTKPGGRKKSTRATTAPRARWTVLLYMAAQLTDELDMHAVRDLREVERAQIGDGVRVLVQINRSWPSRAQRYGISRDGSDLLEADVDEGVTGTRKALEGFLRFAWTESPSDQYFLVLWGHSYGLGFGRDHDDALTLPELRGALDTLKTLRRGKPLEILGANACAMSYAEAAFELRNVATLMVASQVAVPYAGWPYESILGGISATSSPLEVGQLVVDRYVTAFGGVSAARQVAMTVLSLGQGATFKRRFAQLAQALADAADGPDAGSGDRLSYVRSVFRSTAAGDVRPLLDLFDLCVRLEALCDDLDVLQPQAWARVRKLRAAAHAMAAFLNQGPNFAGGTQTDAARATDFVAFHKAHLELSDLRGVGIYAPFVTDATDLMRLGLDEGDAQTGRARYARLGLVSNTGWERLVYETLRAGLPDDMVRNIEASGAVSVADRGDVSQMLASVDSMFDVLDRRILATHVRAKRALQSPPAVPVRPTTPKVPPAVPPQGPGLQLVRHDLLEATFLQLYIPTAPPTTSPPAGPAQTAPNPAAATLMAQIPVSANAAAIAAAAAATRAAVAAAADLVKPTFQDLELMVAEVERSVRRILTNGTFGLGPGPSPVGMTPLGTRVNGVFAKPADGHGGPVKPADGHGGPVKPADRHGPPDNRRGLPPAAGERDGSASSPEAVVAELFSQAGEALAQLESAIADAETVAALVTPPAAAGLPGPPPETQIDRAFRVVADAAADVRRTLRRVLGHPLYGIGPGAAAIGLEDRRELARLGGLSSRGLTLL